MKDKCKTMVTYYPRKKFIKEVYVVCNGKLEDEYMSWYSNGNMKAHYHYHEGKLEGRCIDYYPNGQIHNDYHCNAGHFDGEYMGYFSSGRMDVHYIYENDSIIKVINNNIVT